MTPATKAFLTIICAAAPGCAYAQRAEPGPWVVHVGVTRLAMIDEAVVAVGGVEVPGAQVRSDPQVVPSLSITRFVSPSIGFSLCAGIPPTIRYRGAGTLAAAGPLVDVRYAAPAATLVFSPFRRRAVSPYVGAGIAYLHVLSTTDRGLDAATVRNDAGPVAQAGLSLFPTARFGAFVDIKKAYIRTRVHGLVAGMDATTRVRMDPVVMQAGVSIRL